MKVKFFTTLLLGLFLINFASAVVAQGKWDNGLDTLTIIDGANANFEIDIISMKPSINLNVKLYDSQYNLIHTFVSTTTAEQGYSKEFAVTSSMYSVGSFVIIAQATDSIGSTNSHSLYLTVNPKQTPADTTAPVITLLGSNPQTIELGDSYVELGATAYDTKDGYIAPIVINSNAVNTNLVGIYQVTYNVKDAAGNVAVEKIRTVNVVNPIDEIPVITLVGDNPQAIELGDSYVELGATAYDNQDGDITSSIINYSSSVNTNLEGTYEVAYTVKDSEGNSARKKIRTVIVKNSSSTEDTTVPVITLLGNTPIAILLDSVYIDAGATAYDNQDGDLTSLIVNVSNVNTFVVGTYTVTYDVNDSSGNVAVQVTRTVNVVEELDDEAPQVIIIFPKAKTYYSKDRLFKVQLNEDADVEFSLDGENNVSMDKIADYIFTYEDKVSYGTHELIVYA